MGQDVVRGSLTSPVTFHSGDRGAVRESLSSADMGAREGLESASHRCLAEVGACGRRPISECSRGIRGCRSRGASIWVPGGSSSVSPMCCLLYHGKGAEDQQSLHSMAMNEDRINSCRSLLASHQ